MLMTAYMSSRPGVLIESSCVRGSNNALRYRDVALPGYPQSRGTRASRSGDGGHFDVYEGKEKQVPT
ncbi:hypothetical protein RJZ57_003587, partial [Blastomyces gilchristii]